MLYLAAYEVEEKKGGLTDFHSLHYLKYPRSRMIKLFIPRQGAVCFGLLTSHFVSGVIRMVEHHDLVVNLAGLQRFIFLCYN
ncbi:hypothetical protein DITRI_Ditri07aG0127000 [Diplodiscus trichospermus]